MNPRRSSDPKSLSRTVKDVLAGLGLNKALSRHSVIHRWPQLVDSVIARHAKIDRVSGDTIFVIVDSAVWMSELSAIRLKLLYKVNTALDRDAAPFREIRFSLRSWARTAEPEAQKIPDIPPPDEKHLRVVDRILSPLKDQSLKDIVERIVEKDRRLKELRKSESGKDKS